MDRLKQAYGVAGNSGLKSSLKSEILYFLIVEKHDTLYVLREGNNYYRCELPYEFKVFDIFVAQIISRTPLRLNLTELSNFTNRSKVALKTAEALKLTDTIQYDIIYTLLLQKESVNKNRIENIYKYVNKISAVENLFNLRLTILNVLRQHEYRKSDSIIDYQKYYKKLLHTDYKNVITFSDKNENRELLEFRDKIIFRRDIFNNRILQENLHNDIFSRLPEELIPLVFIIKTGNKQLKFTSFFSESGDYSILTFFETNSGTVTQFLYTGRTNTKIIFSSDFFSQNGQFCTVAQNYLNDELKLHQVQNPSLTASDLFGFSMELFNDLLTDTPPPEGLKHDIITEIKSDYSEKTMINLPLKYLERYFLFLKGIVISRDIIW